jgi:hypothetical protein
MLLEGRRVGGEIERTVTGGSREESRTTRVGGGTVSRNPRPTGGRERTQFLG